VGDRRAYREVELLEALWPGGLFAAVGALVLGGAYAWHRHLRFQREFEDLRRGHEDTGVFLLADMEADPASTVLLPSPPATVFHLAMDGHDQLSLSTYVTNLKELAKAPIVLPNLSVRIEDLLSPVEHERMMWTLLVEDERWAWKDMFLQFEQNMEWNRLVAYGTELMERRQPLPA
jgi:hypothetical protein